jgi:hypothetical protein
MRSRRLDDLADVAFSAEGAERVPLLLKSVRIAVARDAGRQPRPAARGGRQARLAVEGMD